MNLSGPALDQGLTLILPDQGPAVTPILIARKAMNAADQEVARNARPDQI